MQRNVDIGFLKWEDPLVKYQPPPAEPPLILSARTERRFTATHALNALLIVLVASQVFLGFSFVEARRAFETAAVEQRISNMEERFSKISVVLRFLLDQAKSKDGSRQKEQDDASALNADMPIAEVLSDRLNLRTGPGYNNAPLMTVGRGTRLVVEDSSGTWARVVAPNGARAFALKEQLRIEEAPK